jgi:hypothetical protein
MPWSYEPSGDFTEEEAKRYLRNIQRKVGKLSRTTYMDILHYLVGNYTTELSTRMFGGDPNNPMGSVAPFWENVHSIVGGGDMRLEFEGQRFANNNGENFEKHRGIALRMIREHANQMNLL